MCDYTGVECFRMSSVSGAAVRSADRHTQGLSQAGTDGTVDPTGGTLRRVRSEVSITAQKKSAPCLRRSS